MPMGLYILHLHLHGLFRGHDLELGRDADTGGQTNYVLELAKALGQHSDCLLYTSPSPRDKRQSRMPSSA